MSDFPRYLLTRVLDGWLIQEVDKDPILDNAVWKVTNESDIGVELNKLLNK